MISINLDFVPATTKHRMKFKRSTINMTLEAFGLLFIILNWGWLGFVPAFLYCYLLAMKNTFLHLLKRETIIVVEEGDPVGDDSDDEDNLVWEDNTGDAPIFELIGGDVPIDELAVGWINEIVAKLWKECLTPHMTKEFLQLIVDQTCKTLEEEESHLAIFLKHIVIDEVGLMGCPFQITHIVAEDRKDTLVLKIGFLYPGNGKFSVRWSNPDFQLAALENFGFAFNLKLVLGPFHRNFTILNCVSLSFLGRPAITLEGQGIFYLPVGLVMKVISAIMPLLDWVLVDPKTTTLKIPKQNYHFPVISQGEGILNVLLVEGRGLACKDGTFKETGIGFVDRKFKLSASDTFCVVRIGKLWMKTKTIDGKFDPVWNSLVQYPMMTQDFDKELIIELWDENDLTYDELMGLAGVNLEDLDREDQTICDHWIPLPSSSKMMGEIRLMTQFIPCNKDIPIDSPGRAAVLVIFIRSIKTSLSIEPIVAVQISGQKQLMTVKGSFGHFHEYCEEIPLYVKDTTEDLFRIGVHNAFEENMDVGKFLAKEKFQEDLKDTKIQHKLIGEKVWPVLAFQGRRGRTYIEYMNQLDACDAMLEFDVQLFPLEDQTADLQDYKKGED